MINIIEEMQIVICWVATLALPIIGAISVVMFYTSNATYRPPTDFEVWSGLLASTFYAWLIFRNYLKTRYPKMGFIGG